MSPSSELSVRIYLIKDNKETIPLSVALYQLKPERLSDYLLIKPDSGKVGLNRPNKELRAEPSCGSDPAYFHAICSS